ncbi:MAG TPA: alpha-L-fucosidase [Bacteroidota bacterium]|nr:alpha-L-fucosidase [Bacteroidota bacterium]
MKVHRIALVAVLLGSAAISFSRTVPGGGGDARPDLKTNAGSLKKWQAMRFGMFIHWGPVTLRGTEIGWSRGVQVPIRDYDSLYREFNPVLFNAGEWVHTAETAGMKYLVITSKHHDGFCLWDSRYTGYKITSGPFRRDVLRELADECRRQGIMFCTYYSILDWHHADYTTRHGGDPRPVGGSDMNVYRRYLKNQVEELVKSYHTCLLWFDGQWESSWSHRDGMDLYAFARTLDDSLLVNNRVDRCRGDSAGMTAGSSCAGDFETPEQKIGTFDNLHPWESCITLCTQWAWKPNDTMKTFRECILTLAQTAGGGGNLLLNVGPMPDGRIERRQIDRLNEIGAWLGKYGESIYSTSGGPFRTSRRIASTCRENRVYVHVLEMPGQELRLPAIPGRNVTRVRMLGGGPLEASSGRSGIVIPFPAEYRDAVDPVVEIELDGSAETVAPLDAGREPGN